MNPTNLRGTDNNILVNAEPSKHQCQSTKCARSRTPLMDEDATTDMLSEGTAIEQFEVEAKKH